MTPRDALAPQPDPVPTDRSESVTDYLVEQLYGSHYAEVRALLLERREQGRERYGTELLTHTGRDALLDALQEAVDLVGYLAQHEMEGRAPEQLLSGAIQLLRSIVRELP